MKIYSKLGTAVLGVGMLLLSSCNDFLDREPLDKITPEIYFANEADLAAYSLGCYGFPTNDPTKFSIGVIANDNGTDNQAASEGSTGTWVPGEKRVAAKDGAWNFDGIRKCNYFFNRVLPKYEAGTINGSVENIRHYIGEMYFIRAYNYFNKLAALGDFPIITEVLPDDHGTLIANSLRRPRHEVARFILKDLDKAIEMMGEDSPNGKNRLTRKAGLLFKSRVALFEGTWLKYHNGTDRVPGGPGWPGATMDYNKDFSIDMDAEIKFFLNEAKEAAARVADAVRLTESTDMVNPEKGDPYNWNPYYEMFCAVDMDPIDEVLFWRAYDVSLGVGHSAGIYLVRAGGNMGYTRGMVDAFLMQDGLPIYVSKDYQGDVSLNKFKKGRDRRLQLFVAAPDDSLTLKGPIRGNESFGTPLILNAPAERCPTGYAPRKCMSYDPAQYPTYSGRVNSYGCIIFRAVEAYLNYIEAAYELDGRLDAKATEYWKQIRRRAGVSDDLDKTINATDLEKENDWAKHSGNQLVSPALFNIRRERRTEMMSEGLRMHDLKRWRALDKVQYYHIEGFNLWGGEIEKLYAGKLIPSGTANKVPNVSSKEISGTTYLRIYQVQDKSKNLLFDGYDWCPANYLEPIAAIHFTLTASDIDNPETSVIYQNPGWPKIANESAIGY